MDCEDVMPEPAIAIFSLKIKKIFYTILKVAFHLQLLQNIGYIPHVVQYILEPILHPIVCTSQCPTSILPLSPPHW